MDSMKQQKCSLYNGLKENGITMLNRAWKIKSEVKVMITVFYIDDVVHEGTVS